MNLRVALLGLIATALARAQIAINGPSSAVAPSAARSLDSSLGCHPNPHNCQYCSKLYNCAECVRDLDNCCYWPNDRFAGTDVNPEILHLVAKFCTRPLAPQLQVQKFCLKQASPFQTNKGFVEDGTTPGVAATQPALNATDTVTTQQAVQATTPVVQPVVKSVTAQQALQAKQGLADDATTPVASNTAVSAQLAQDDSSTTTAAQQAVDESTSTTSASSNAASVSVTAQPALDASSTVPASAPSDASTTAQQALDESTVTTSDATSTSVTGQSALDGSNTETTSAPSGTSTSAQQALDESTVTTSLPSDAASASVTAQSALDGSNTETTSAPSGTSTSAQQALDESTVTTSLPSDAASASVTAQSALDGSSTVTEQQVVTSSEPAGTSTAAQDGSSTVATQQALGESTVTSSAPLDAVSTSVSSQTALDGSSTGTTSAPSDTPTTVQQALDESTVTTSVSSNDASTSVTALDSSSTISALKGSSERPKPETIAASANGNAIGGGVQTFNEEVTVAEGSTVSMTVTTAEPSGTSTTAQNDLSTVTAVEGSSTVAISALKGSTERPVAQIIGAAQNFNEETTVPGGSTVSMQTTMSIRGSSSAAEMTETPARVNDQATEATSMTPDVDFNGNLPAGTTTLGASTEGPSGQPQSRSEIPIVSTTQPIAQNCQTVCPLSRSKQKCVKCVFQSRMCCFGVETGLYIKASEQYQQAKQLCFN
ncbi:hypothetical protein Ciccas_005806 [Cichlidogyrus casuarinus]|uniref:Uncharacterized protein n=1 Tax=Cichlidogyrus casuarinus TaxID=1844966 RepID=A0ABD2Q7L2_9PLAT